MSNDLRILISAQLNVGKSIGDINTAIRGLEKKISKLNLGINIDQNALKTLHNFNLQMQNLQKSALETQKVIDEAIMPDGTKVKRTYYDGINKEFSEVATNAKKTASSMQGVSNNTNQATNSTKQLNHEISKKFRLNRESVMESQKGLGILKQEYGDHKNIHRIQVERNQQGKILATRLTTNHQKAREITAQEKQQTAELQRQLNLEQRKMQVKAQEMIRQYPSVDRNRIQNILAESNAMTAQGNTLQTVRRRYAELNMQMREVEAQTKRVTANTNTLSGAFQNAMVKFPIWMAASTAFVKGLYIGNDISKLS